MLQNSGVVALSPGISITVGKGRLVSGYLISEQKWIELSRKVPLQISEIAGDRTTGWKVKLSAPNKNTRVHVLVSQV